MNIIESIIAANRTREHSNLIRRIAKSMEELGEVCEAYLNVTSAGNGKGKTWNDVREELVDNFIVATDLLYTKLPNEEQITDAELDEIISEMVDRKLAKWKNNRNTGKASTDAE